MVDGWTDKKAVFAYLASSWLFNPTHFAERMRDESYIRHIDKRGQPSFLAFVNDWIPKHFRVTDLRTRVRLVSRPNPIHPCDA